jgi:hypothetical protein
MTFQRLLTANLQFAVSEPSLGEEFVIRICHKWYLNPRIVHTRVVVMSIA